MTKQLAHSPVKAVVMAGGEGSRLRPITLNIPKPLVPVANRPIMGHIIELLRAHGVTEIVTTLHYLADEIQNVFGDGSEYGVSLTHSLEDTPLGTAGAVKQAESQLSQGTFIIISGDALTDCDLTKALEFHREKGSLATIVLSRVPNPLEFGIVMTQPDGKIDRFLEKPGWGEVFSDTVNTGIYILEPEIFDYIHPHTNTDWSKDVFPKLLAENKPMYGFVMEQYWCDVGTLEQYREAQEDFLQRKLSISMAGTEISPGIWVGENTVIDESAVLESPICIGSNVRIKRKALIGAGSVIGDSCLVEEGAQVERSVIWDRCYIGNEVKIHGAIVGSRVTLKRDTRLQDGCVVGDRCLLDVGSTIRPRVKIWPDKTIERGSTVTMSLVTGNRWRGALFRELGVAGLSNIEITPEFATRLGLAFGSIFPENSRILACRDSSRSSRMIKRSLIAALTSAGCQVIDMHGLAMPVLRHALKYNEAVAAVSIRKSPGNNRLSLIEFLDEQGAYLAQQIERKVEAAFFREDFHRADPESLGIIEEASQTTEAYTRDFLKLLPVSKKERRSRIVVDYGYSSVSPILPYILARAGIDAISLNSFNDARSAPRRPIEVQDHISNLQQIVASVGCDLGVLILNEGENIAAVDDQGIALTGNTLFAAMCQLMATHQPNGEIVIEATAPSRLENLLKTQGIAVRRCRTGVRDLIQESQGTGTTFAGNENGGFIFPQFHTGFDGLFAITTLVKLLQSSNLKLSELVAQLPEFHVAYEDVACEWEVKGTVMRRLAERSDPNRMVELVDGIRFYNEDSWVLILPDSFEPVFRIIAESPSLVESQALIREYSGLISQFQAEPS